MLSYLCLSVFICGYYALLRGPHGATVMWKISLAECFASGDGRPFALRIRRTLERARGVSYHEFASIPGMPLWTLRRGPA